MRSLSLLRRALLIIVGLLSVAVGVVGIFVPLLPTTVFLLLAAACFVRSSDRLYRRLITNRVFGSYIRNYREHRAMPLGAKWCAASVHLVNDRDERLVRGHPGSSRRPARGRHRRHRAHHPDPDASRRRGARAARAGGGGAPGER